jgi:outer membrane protein
MKKLLIVFGIVMGFLLATVPVMAAKEAPVKIGVIDTQKILRESKAAKAAQSVFMKDLEAKRVIYQAKEKDIKDLDQELKNQNIKLSAESRKEKTEKLAQEVKEFKRLEADMEEALKKKEVELTRRLLSEIAQIVRTFSKKEHYTVILEKGSVVVADDAIDITDRIIMLYDAGKK